MKALLIFVITFLIGWRTWSAPKDNLSIERYQFLKQPLSIKLENILLEKIEPIGEIIESHKEAKYLQVDDLVYLDLQKQAVAVGDRFMIYEDLGGVKIPNTLLQQTGQHIRIKGSLEVTKVIGNTIAAVIREATSYVSIGDKLTQEMNWVVPLQPKEPKKVLGGLVLGSAQKSNMIGAFDFVFIDKGKKDGLELNDRLFVVRSKDTEVKSKITLPPVTIAELVVVQIQNNVATAYCLSSVTSFEAGAQFKTARKEAQFADEQTPQVKDLLRNTPPLQ